MHGTYLWVSSQICCRTSEGGDVLSNLELPSLTFGIAIGQLAINIYCTLTMICRWK